MSETFFEAIEELESMTREPSDVLEKMNSRLSARELQLVLVYFSQDGRDSWCALEVFKWLKKEIQVDEETMELMISIMCGWVKKMIESKGNVVEVADFLVDMDCVGLKPSFNMIEKEEEWNEEVVVMKKIVGDGDGGIERRLLELVMVREGNERKLVRVTGEREGNLDSFRRGRRESG